jgi:hypothetical protein
LVGFPLGRPAENANWPPHYVARKTEELYQYVCTFDHRAIGITWRGEQRDCNNKSTGECAYPSFYDPQQLNRYGQSATDYVVMPIPRSGTDYCRKGPVDLLVDSYPGNYQVQGAYYGEHSYCALSTLQARTSPITLPTPYPQCFNMACDIYDRIVVNVANQTQICREKGDLIKFEGFNGEITCPDPAILCGIDRYDVPAQALPTVTRSPAPGSPAVTAEPLPAPESGFSYHVNYYQSQTYTWKFVTVTRGVFDTSVRTYAIVDGVGQWILTGVSGYTGPVSVYDWSKVAVTVPYYTLVSTAEQLWGNISGAGWVGIIAAVVALVAFIGGTCYCQKKADQEWEREQALYARQRRAGSTRGSVRGRRASMKAPAKAGTKTGAKTGAKKSGPGRKSKV